MNISKGVVYDGNLFYPSYSAFSCVNLPWIGATQLGKLPIQLGKPTWDSKMSQIILVGRRKIFI